MDRAVSFFDTYPLDSDLSIKWYYPPCEVLGPEATSPFEHDLEYCINYSGSLTLFCKNCLKGLLKLIIIYQLLINALLLLLMYWANCWNLPPSPFEHDLEYCINYSGSLTLFCKNCLKGLLKLIIIYQLLINALLLLLMYWANCWNLPPNIFGFLGVHRKLNSCLLSLMFFWTGG